MKTDYPQLDRLLGVMRSLRDPKSGCPWDQEQTFSSIVPHTIEEAYEVADAITNGSMEDVQDELGDLLFQVVFYAQLGDEQAVFDFESIAKTVADKLVRRHPHVFGDVSTSDAEQLSKQWDAIKQQERADAGKVHDDSVLANIPVGLAPLIRATKLQKKCAKVGFDWPKIEPVVDKIHEEIDEVMELVHLKSPSQDRLEDEIGDLLFAVVNLARHLNVNAEAALRRANSKFERRFRAVEQYLLNMNCSVNQASLDVMEQAWQKVKEYENEHA